jgi:hypothetical protein
MSRYLRPQSPNARWRGAAYPRVIQIPRTEGPAHIAPSLPDALGPERGNYVRLPGVNFPPAGGIAVDVDGDANIAPGGSATLLSVTIPDTQRFRVMGIGFGADDETALRFLTWSIQFNNVPTSGYTQKNAVIGTIVQLAELFISAGSSQTMIVVGNADPTAVLTYRYICRIRGYFYAEKVSD